MKIEKSEAKKMKERAGDGFIREELCQWVIDAGWK